MMPKMRFGNRCGESGGNIHTHTLSHAYTHKRKIVNPVDGYDLFGPAH